MMSSDASAVLERIMAATGARLKEERERLGFSQTAFAQIADSTKRSQIDYEKGMTQPRSGYLAAISLIGADVQYIVTGLRSPSLLSHDEVTLALKFRNLTKNKKEATLMVINELVKTN